MVKTSAELMRCFAMSPAQIMSTDTPDMTDMTERKIATKTMLKECETELKNLFLAASPFPPYTILPVDSFGEEEKRKLWLHSEAAKARIHDIFSNLKLNFGNGSEENVVNNLQFALRQGLARVQALLGFVCEYLAHQKEGFSQESYESYIRPCMDFLDKLARTKDDSGYPKDDERLLGEFISAVKENHYKPIGENYSISKEGITFNKLDDYPFDPTRECFVRSLLFKFDLCLEQGSQSETVNMIQAFYWYVARKVEDALFKRN